MHESENFNFSQGKEQSSLKEGRLDLTKKNLREGNFKTRKQLLNELLAPSPDAEKYEFRGHRYFNEKDCIEVISSRIRAPLPGALPMGENSQGVQFFRLADTEPVGSISFWKNIGRQITEDARPYQKRRGTVGGGAKTLEFKEYRESDTVQIFVPERPGKSIEDLLLAIFVVGLGIQNARTIWLTAQSKRYDKVAEEKAQEMRDLVLLQEKGLRIAVSSGLLNYRKMYGSLALWTSDRFCFLSRYCPQELPKGKVFFRLDNPYSKRLPPFRDGIFTLNNLEDASLPAGIVRLPTISENFIASNGFFSKDDLTRGF